MKKFIFGLILCASLVFGGVAMAETVDNSTIGNCQFAEIVVALLHLDVPQAQIVKNILGCISSSAPIASQIPSVDLKINNNDGFLTVGVGETLRLSWTSQNVSSCYSSGSAAGAANLWPWALRNLNEGTEVIITEAMAGKIIDFTVACGTGPTSSQTQASDTVRVLVLGLGVSNPQVADGVPVLVPVPSSVNLKINNTDGPLSVGSSGTLNLSWTSNGVNSCYTSGDAGGTNVWPWAARPVSGSAVVTVTPAMQGKTVEFAIRCGSGPSASETQATDVVHVTVAPAPAPAVSADLKINGSDGTVDVQVGNTVQLAWTTSGVSSCHTSGDIGSTNVWPWALRNTNSNSSMTITEAMKGKTVNVTLGCGSGPSAAQTQVTDMVRVKVAK